MMPETVPDLEHDWKWGEIGLAHAGILPDWNLCQEAPCRGGSRRSWAGMRPVSSGNWTERPWSEGQATCTSWPERLDNDSWRAVNSVLVRWALDVCLLCQVPGAFLQRPSYRGPVVWPAPSRPGRSGAPPLALGPKAKHLLIISCRPSEHEIGGDHSCQKDPYD